MVVSGPRVARTEAAVRTPQAAATGRRRIGARGRRDGRTSREREWASVVESRRIDAVHDACVDRAPAEAVIAFRTTCDPSAWAWTAAQASIAGGWHRLGGVPRRLRRAGVGGAARRLPVGPPPGARARPRRSRGPHDDAASAPRSAHRKPPASPCLRPGQATRSTGGPVTRAVTRHLGVAVSPIRSPGSRRARARSVSSSPSTAVACSRRTSWSSRGHLAHATRPDEMAPRTRRSTGPPQQPLRSGPLISRGSQDVRGGS